MGVAVFLGYVFSVQSDLLSFGGPGCQGVVSLLRQFAQVGGGCFCLLLRCFLAEGEEEEARFLF